MLAGVQCLLIFNRIVITGKNLLFYFTTKLSQNPIAICGYWFALLIDLLVIISRILIIRYSVVMYIDM